MTRWLWTLRHFSRRLWVRASLIGVLAVLTAVLAAVAEHVIPWEIPGSIAADSVDGLLTIIASSMLAVTTFSLSVMTAAYAAASSGVTPRAIKLLMEDRVTQNVLSTFIGSFLFSIVGIIVLKTGAYGERGRVILFVVTIAVIALIVVSLLRWIDYLIRLGRIGETSNLIERTACEALEARRADPYLGGTPLAPGTRPPAGSEAITAEAIGYITFVDVAALAHCAERWDRDIQVAVLPGRFVHRDSPLAWVLPGGRTDRDEALHAAVRAAFSVEIERSFDQDPRFGLAVMSEIGSGALAPGKGDSGTALDIVGRVTRLMALWADARHEAPTQPPRHPRVQVPALDVDDLFEDAYLLLARDGAAFIEVQLCLQKALHALARIGDERFRAAALYHAALARARADLALPLSADRDRLGLLIRELEAGRYC